jgi:hypothetical protein
LGVHTYIAFHRSYKLVRWLQDVEQIRTLDYILYNLNYTPTFEEQSWREITSRGMRGGGNIWIPLLDNWFSLVVKVVSLMCWLPFTPRKIHGALQGPKCRCKDEVNWKMQLPRREWSHNTPSCSREAQPTVLLHAKSFYIFITKNSYQRLFMSVSSMKSRSIIQWSLRNLVM